MGDNKNSKKGNSNKIIGKQSLRAKWWSLKTKKRKSEKW